MNHDLENATIAAQCANLQHDVAGADSDMGTAGGGGVELGEG